MIEFVTLSCPSCGGELQITNDIQRFACAHCGKQHIVNRKGGIVSLSPVIDAINRVGIGVDKTASELAIVRLQKEISELLLQRDIISSQKPQLSERATVLTFGLFSGVIGTVLLLIGALCKASSNSSIFALFIFFGILVIILTIIYFVTTPHKNEPRKLSRKEEIDLKIAKANRELERHRRIVSD